MLRVQASDLASLNRSLRGRHLQSIAKAPCPPPPPVPGPRLGDPSSELAAHHLFAPTELSDLAPPSSGVARITSKELPLPSWKGSAQEPERAWKVNLELDDAEIGRLYGHGLARGAIVWRPGMADWRPLLVTPELQPLLRQTRLEPSSSETPTAPASEPAPTEPFWIPNWDDTPPDGMRAPDDHEASLSRSARRVDTMPAIRLRDLEGSRFRFGRRQVEWAIAALVSAALVGWMSSRVRAPSSAVELSADAAAPTIAGVGTLPQTVAAALAPPRTTIPTVLVSELPMLREQAVNLAVRESSADGSANPEPPSRQPAGASREAPTRTGPVRRELVSALGRATRNAAACGAFEARTRVVVTFANSGEVRDVAVRGQGLSQHERSCVTKAVRRARISAFNGPPVTVAKSF